MAVHKQYSSIWCLLWLYQISIPIYLPIFERTATGFVIPSKFARCYVDASVTCDGQMRNASFHGFRAIEPSVVTVDAHCKAALLVRRGWLNLFDLPSTVHDIKRHPAVQRKFCYHLGRCTLTAPVWIVGCNFDFNLFYARCSTALKPALPCNSQRGAQHIGEKPLNCIHCAW